MKKSSLLINKHVFNRSNDSAMVVERQPLAVPARKFNIVVINKVKEARYYKVRGYSKCRGKIFSCPSEAGKGISRGE